MSVSLISLTFWATSDRQSDVKGACMAWTLAEESTEEKASSARVNSGAGALGYKRECQRKLFVAD